MSFSQRLKDARMNAGKTQQEVADILGIDKSTCSGYETGKREPFVERIKDLASIFGVTGDYLLETGFDEPDTKKSPDSTEVEAEDSKRVFMLFYKFLVEAGYVGEGDELSDTQAKGAAAAIKVIDIFFESAQGYSVSDA